MTVFQKGDIVWVRTGLGNHEEPATILDPSCHYKHSHEYVNDNNSSSSNMDVDGSGRMEEKKENDSLNENDNNDGILVRYNVSFVEEIVCCKNVRSLFDSDDSNQDSDNGLNETSRRKRRSTRIARNSNTINATISSLATSAKDSFTKDKNDIIGTTSKANTANRGEKTIEAQDSDKRNIPDDQTDGNDDGDNLTLMKLKSNSNKSKTNPQKKRKVLENNQNRNNIAASTPKLETPSPPKKRKRMIRKEGDESQEEEMTKLTSSPYFNKNKDNDYQEHDSNDLNSKGENNLLIKNATNVVEKKAKSTKVRAKAKPKTKGKTEAKLKPKTKASREIKSEKVAKTKTATKKKNIENKVIAGKPDGNGGLVPSNATYIIEYAKTGRSTCKRCDQKINKNEIRVGHRPLFRGKPGFRIYKHLHCIVFSSSVCTIEDVDGYEELSAQDCDALEKRIQESKIEIKEENEALDPDELVQKGFEGEVRDKPKGLKANLLPFQREGVSWMYCQEVNVPNIRGGILADEMGMGKTLQTITTMLDNRPMLQHSRPGAKHPPLCPDELRKKLEAEEDLWNSGLKEWNHEIKMNNVPHSILPRKKKGSGGAGGARAGTLVICPVIALSQWKSEIEKFCEEHALTVCIYHGPDRAKNISREVMRKYDVVLTTYQVIEQDFRKMVSPNKVKCPNCGNKFKIDKLHVHLKYFCGEGAQRTEAQSRTRRNSDRNGSTTTTSSAAIRRRGNTATKHGDKKKMTKTSTKKVFKVKASKDYDSESDLSIQPDASIVMTKARSSRAAATKAKKRVSIAAKNERKSKRDIEDSEEDYVESDEDYDDDYDDGDVESLADDSSSEDDAVIRRAKKRQATAFQKSKKDKGSKKGRKIEKKEFTKDIESLTDESSSDDDAAIRRAKKRQAKAFQKSKKDKGSKEGKKLEKKEFSKKKDKDKATKGKSKTKQMKKSMKMMKKKGKGYQSSSSDSDSASDNDSDSFEVDMEALIAEAMAGCQLSILHSFCWWRIVLDEAHFIKSRSSQTSAAAFALIGIHRWCLSGTPLQNRVGEFYSLVRFLRLDPMAHYFCRSKDCDCKQVHYRMKNNRCLDCGCSSIQHYSYFNRQILNPIQRDGYANDGRRAMFTLKNEVLDKCLLRRTKETRAEDMNLPPRIVTIKTVRLHPIEEDFYNAVFTKTTSSFNDYVAEGTLLNNYAHIFDLLMRMRQAVCHPYLVVYSKRDMARRASAVPIASNGSVDCHLCDDPPTDRVVSTCCETVFCKSCVLEYMEMSAGVGGENATPCPNCRNPFTIDLSQIQEIEVNNSSLSCKEKVSRIGLPSLRELPNVASGSILRRIDLTEFATSSKIEALTMELVNMRKSSPGSKAIVFSQFVNMLDLIRWRLHSDPCLSEMGLGVRALHGSMDVKSRDAALKDFREDHTVRVLLMSLKAGGVALNLTVANHIYLMDPWWNPAAEMQAIDRTHRLGQYRPIRAVRFIAANTVEERILQLQEKKRLVFDGTVGRDAGSLKMLTVDDMKSLFA